MPSIGDPSLFLPAIIAVAVMVVIGIWARSFKLGGGAGFIVLLYVGLQTNDNLLQGYSLIALMFVSLAAAVFLARIVLGGTGGRVKQ